MSQSKTMKTFLLLIVGCIFATQACAEERQLIEIAIHHFRNKESAERFDRMMQNAALPVMKEQGIGPVGVFQVADSKILDDNDRVTITPFNSMEEKLRLRKAFVAATGFWDNAKDYLMQEPGNPATERIEKMLFESFEGMPKLKVPGEPGEAPRRFELRTYKSENEIQGLLKVQMFNEGEMDLFEKVGLQAIFYGEALAASDLPQLTYMLVHDDEETQKKTWKTFIEHPEWKTLKNEEQYKVIKLTITKHMLTATDYSQIR